LIPNFDDDEDSSFDSQIVISDFPDRIKINTKNQAVGDAVGTFKKLTKAGARLVGQKVTGGQFLGIVGAIEEDDDDEDWEERKHWFAFLHVFDSDGEHVHATYEHFGTSNEGEDDIVEKAQQWLAEQLEELFVKHKPKDISVESFCVEIETPWDDDIEVGLIESDEDDEDHPCIEVIPGDVRLIPPWDGTFENL
jgi:hypothetical protein